VKKRPRLLIISFVLLCIAGFLWRKTLVLGAVKGLLLMTFGAQHVHYDKMGWEGDAIAIENLSVTGSQFALGVDHLEVRWHLTHIGVVLRHPALHITSHETPRKAGSAAMALKYIVWEVEEGQLQVEQLAPLYFSVAQAENALACFTLAHAPTALEAPAFYGSLTASQGGWELQFVLQEQELSRLMPLWAFWGSEGIWDRAEGAAVAKGKLKLARDFSLYDFSGVAELTHCAFGNTSQGVEIELEQLSMTVQSDASKQLRGRLLVSAAKLCDRNHFPFECTIQQAQCDLNAAQMCQIKAHGELISEGAALPFACTGEGVLQEGLSVDLQLADCEMHLNFQRQSAREALVQVDLKDLSAAMLQRLIAQRFWVDGRANAQFALHFVDCRVQAVEVQHIALTACRLYAEEQGMTLFLNQAQGEKWQLYPGAEYWQLESAALHLQQGECLLHLAKERMLEITRISGDLNIAGGVWRASYLSGLCEGVRGELIVHGSAAPHLAEVLLRREGSQPLEAALVCDVADRTLALQGDVWIGEEKLCVGADFTLVASQLSEFLFAKRYGIALKQGWFEAEELTQPSYGPWIQQHLGEMQLSGKLRLQGQFDLRGINVLVFGSDVLLCDPMVDLFLPTLGDKGARLRLDLAQNQWQGSIPLVDAELHYRDRSLHIDGIQALCHLEAARLSAPTFLAMCEGMRLRGKFDLFFKGRDQIELDLSADECAGSVQSLLKVMGHFPAFHLPPYAISGHFKSGEKGFQLHAKLSAQEAQAKWSLRGALKGLSVDGLEDRPSGTLCEAEAQLLADSATQRFSLEKLRGKWVFPNRFSLDLFMPRLVLDMAAQPLLDFELQLKDRDKKVLELAGRAQLGLGDCWTLAFDERRALLCDTPLNVSSCSYRAHDGMLAFDLAPTFTSTHLVSLERLLSQLDVMPATEMLDSLEGVFHTRISTQDIRQELCVHVESKEVTVAGRRIPHFELDAVHRAHRWQIKRLQADLLSLTAELEHLPDTVALHHVRGKWGQAAFVGSGSFQLRERQGQLSCTVDLATPVPMKLWNSKPLHFAQVEPHTWIVRSTPWHLQHLKEGIPLGALQMGEIKLSGASGTLRSLQFSLKPDLLAKFAEAKLIPGMLSQLQFGEVLQGQAEASWTPQGLTLHGRLRDGEYGYAAQHFTFESIVFRYAQNQLQLKGRTTFHSQALHAGLELHLSEGLSGVVLLADGASSVGIRAEFMAQPEGLRWKRIAGECCGLECSFSESRRDILHGSASIDGGKLFALFPSLQRFKLGSGYSVDGDLVLAKQAMAFKGHIKGEEFELLGVQMHHLQAGIEATPSRIVLSNATIQDRAGTIGLKRIAFEKKKDWELSIPLLSVRDFRPSLMRKVGAPPSPLKPFVIRQGALLDIHANLSHPESLEGVGHLTFSNQEKRGASLFDVPLEKIKNFGLDPGLLTPVQGEVELELRGDKFYFLLLKNAFSEGERSQFYLSPERTLSYIDFNGKVYINLKMRQDVTLKLTEPFTLTIRGNLEKLRYGLKY